jgi:cbb3-type cytochrome oxidase subunit 3
MSGVDIQLFAFIAWMIASMIVFIALIAWVLWPGNGPLFEKHGSIPLADETDEARS